MVLGGFVMFFSDAPHLKSVIPLAIAFAATGGLSNVVQKIVFEAEGFTSGYVFFTLGSSAAAALLLLRPSWRRQIFYQSRTISSRSRWRYLANRGTSGLGSILVYVAINRASPAIVDAMSGVRYAVIFLGTFLIAKLRPQWLSEEFSRHTFLAKSLATASVIAGLVLVGLVRQS
jgi:drug/metabolite transporter (DMT)-like permease